MMYRMDDPANPAPRDRPILVFYDHDADPYRDPADPDRLTDYAALAEDGDFLTGRGWVVAKWDNGYTHGWDEIVPGGWYPWIDGDYADQVCNPVAWLPLPEVE
jgi:hypothetical protein